MNKIDKIVKKQMKKYYVMMPSEGAGHIVDLFELRKGEKIPKADPVIHGSVVSYMTLEQAIPIMKTDKLYGFFDNSVGLMKFPKELYNYLLNELGEEALGGIKSVESEHN